MSSVFKVSNLKVGWVIKNKKLGEFIKSLRIAQNISTKEMIKYLDVLETKYIQYENGK